MTNERIAEIKRLLEGISPAPWTADRNGYVYSGDGNTLIDVYGAPADTLLIAAAPTAIAELLAEIERIPTSPRCPICKGVMHADNTEFTADGAFQHKCEEVE